MESATLGPVARAMGVDWGCVLATADPVPEGRRLEPGEFDENERLAMEVVLEAIGRLDRSSGD